MACRVLINVNLEILVSSPLDSSKEDVINWKLRIQIWQHISPILVYMPAYNVTLPSKCKVYFHDSYTLIAKLSLWSVLINGTWQKWCYTTSKARFPALAFTLLGCGPDITKLGRNLSGFPAHPDPICVWVNTDQISKETA